MTGNPFHNPGKVRLADDSPGTPICCNVSTGSWQEKSSLSVKKRGAGVPALAAVSATNNEKVETR